MTSELIDFVIDERLDQSEVMRLSIPAASRKAYLLEPDYELGWEDRRFIVTEVESNREGTRTIKAVECEATWYRLGDTTYVGSFINSGQTPKRGLSAILKGTDWSVGVETTLDTTEFSLEAQDKTRLELLRLWAKVTGKHLAFTPASKTVDLKDERGADLGLGFRYRRNLRRVRKRERPPLVTVLFPYGADGLTISGVNGGLPYIEDFSYYTSRGLTLTEARERFTRSRVFSDSTFIVDTDLLAAAQTKLDELAQAVTTYELDVVDLTELTHLPELIRVGDSVRVQDPEFAEDLVTTVVRYERHPKQPARNHIELSTLPALAPDPSVSSSRPSSALEWRQFSGPVRADYQIRNDGRYVTNRIALRFREAGLAHYHLDLRATGVGAGVMHIEVFDDVDEVTIFRTLDVPYTDGEAVQGVISWSAFDLEGSYDYRVRVSTTASGGPDPAMGVDLTADPEGTASFWIMAHGAVQETPVADNSERFDYNGNRCGGAGTVQTFTVPDDVEEISFVVAGSGAYQAGSDGTPGNGCTLRGKFAVVPGEEFEIYVGGMNDQGNRQIGGWPNAGDGGLYSTPGSGGGAASWIVRAGQSFTDAVVVAPGGGGMGGGGFGSAADGSGGDGGFYAGADGTSHSWGIPDGGAGFGATQDAPGLGGGPVGGLYAEDGDTDGLGHGGDAFASPGSGTLGVGSGGGGGGWHGGGGGRSEGNGAGGGSGWADLSIVFDLEISDGDNSDVGYIELSWESPV